MPCMQDIERYCSTYTNRNFLMKVILSSGHAQDYEDMAKSLTELTVSES